MGNLKRRAAIMIAFISMVSVSLPVHGMSRIESAVEDTAEYIMRTVPEPAVSPVGGEWTVLGLSAWAGRRRKAFMTRTLIIWEMSFPKRQVFCIQKNILNIQEP